MASIIEDLKNEARILHRRVRAGDAAATERLGRAGVSGESVTRADCLRAVAVDLGFDGWSHAVHVLAGKPVTSFGTLLYPHGGHAHWNIWCASYDEARRIRAEHGGYLLAYRHQFFIVDRHFIETLGLDPDDADWEEVGRDWVKPERPEARTRLCEKLVRARRTGLSSAN